MVVGSRCWFGCYLWCYQINKCSQQDLIRQFHNTHINWPAIEKQLLTWGDLFCAGKKLRQILFNYIENSHTSVN
jgi:hypothetical protein